MPLEMLAFTDELFHIGTPNDGYFQMAAITVPMMMQQTMRLWYSH